MEEEISLREIIETIWNGKWLIAVITSIAVFLSGIVSFFVLDPVYEAQATFMLNTSKPSEKEINDALDAVIGSYSQYPQLTTQTYVEQVKNRAIMQKVIDQLNLAEKEINYEGLRKKISTEIVKDTNLLRIKVKDSDPQLALKIASAVTTEFVQFINEKIQEQMLKSAELLKQQMDKEEQRFAQEADQLKAFLQQPTSVEELSQEISSRLGQLTSYKKELEDIEVELQVNGVGLEQTKVELNSTPQILKTKKSLANDSYMHSVVSEESNQSQAETGSYTLNNEEINPIYIHLKQQVSNYKITIEILENKKDLLQERIKSNQAKLEELRVLHAEKQLEYEQLQIRVNNAKNMYNTFAKKYEEARVTGTAQFGDSNIMVVTPPLEPIEPVGPKKLLNMAIAGIVGGMMSLMIVLFRYYWTMGTTSFNGRSNNASF
jgi:succinoglycan biosynthesis transport protein ExoP